MKQIDNKLSINWEYEPVKYQHFTDLGNYVLKLEDADFADFERANALNAKIGDIYPHCCTACVKRNKKDEVIIGRNMDVNVSQNPAYLTRIKGGKYDTVAFTYLGPGGRHSYQDLAAQDQDLDDLLMIPYQATDAMNETGFFAESNMREIDPDFDMNCTGTNPGKLRVSTLSAPTLVALNCATVKEAIEFLNNSYDWYSAGLEVNGVGEEKESWNLAMIMGDATGEYGLVEFGKNGIYYTPYANGQGNYYIHPSLAEYAVYGTGYGRFAACLKGLPECETAEDMLHNMEACMWKNELLNPGCLGYSDHESNLTMRRQRSQEDMQKGFEAQMAPFKEASLAYYNGNEKPLRDNGKVWTTSFNFGVNCGKKHLILRLWEKDNVQIEYQW